MKKNALILDEFYVTFGETRYCLDFIFSNNSLSDEFTMLMAERFGETLAQKWFFYQRDIHNQLYIPTSDEKCFSLERGHITGLQRTLDTKEIEQAFNMIISVAREMDIDVIRRKAINLSEHVVYGQPLQYDYKAILETKKVNQGNTPKI